LTNPGYSLTLRTPPLELPDFFASMSDMNKASLVALTNDGLISSELAARIGVAIRDVIERESAPGSKRSHDYLDFERDLIQAAGPDASRLHLGRSRQDMMSTGVSMWLRAAHLAAFDDLLAVHRALLDLATRHIETVMPTYTHGVQAQPTSVAHYMLAFVAALARAEERIIESYVRANRSPLGAGAGTTSAFALNRDRLAALLGFDDIIDNAFDANLVTPIDSTLEFVGILSTLAIVLAQWTQDLHAQFYLPKPWLVLDPGSMLTGISSMMPQKRNPRVLELLREHASIIVGAANSMVLLAHNTSSGMTDVRETVTTVVPLGRVHELLFLTRRTIEAIVIDPQRSMAEVNRDYSTMTNLAEHLVQAAGVPFREAHEFASRLTDYGRQRHLTPPEIPYSDAASLYQQHSATAFPLSDEEFGRTINPAHVVATRQGGGGPQRREVERMLTAASQTLAEHERWLTARRSAAADARAMLEAAFGQLVATAMARSGAA
jgi:argininosuccinate lyase